MCDPCIQHGVWFPLTATPSCTCSTHTHTRIEQKRVCVGVCVSLKARQCFSSRAGSECFGVIRGVCSILPEGSAAWRIKSPTCLCFSDLCCPGNRCREFPFLHFFFFLYTIHIAPHHHHQRRRHHHLYTPHAAAAAAAASSPTTCRIVQSHTHTHTLTLYTQFPIYCSHFTMSQD